MVIKSQDVLVTLKLLASGGLHSPFSVLAKELGISASEANAAYHRAKQAGLISGERNDVIKSAVAEMLIHGLKYFIPVRPEGRTRGMATGFAAPPLIDSFTQSEGNHDIPVWPDPEGDQVGFAIRPLYHSVPFAAKRDPVLYEWLVLADALRGAGRAREKQIAEKIIRQRLDYHATS